MSQPNLGFRPRAFFPHGANGAPSSRSSLLPPIEREAKASMTRMLLHREDAS